MKKNPNKGFTNDWMDFNLDGKYRKRRIKGKDKKYMKGLTRKRIKYDTLKEIEACENDP